MPQVEAYGHERVLKPYQSPVKEARCDLRVLASPPYELLIITVNSDQVFFKESHITSLDAMQAAAL